MKIEQHIYEMERKRKELRNSQSTNKRLRPKSKSNLEVIYEQTHRCLHRNEG